MELVCARVRTLLTRDHALVEVAGGERSQVIDTLLGAAVLSPSLAASVTIRVRCAPAFTFQARWPDGRVEEPPPDERPAQKAALATLETDLARAAEAQKLAAERLRDASRAAVAARARVTAPAPSRPPATVAPRSWLRRMLARMAAFVRALFGRGAAPSLPSAPAPAPSLPPAAPDLLGLEAALAGAEARLASLASERDERHRAIGSYDADRRRRTYARVVELTASHAPGWIELDLGAPELPAGIALVLRPPPTAAARDREPVDATLFADATTATAPMADDRPTLRVERPLSRPSLVAQLERIAQQRPVGVARRIVAALCLCRNHILDLDRRARAAYDERTRELTARRVDVAEAVRRQEASAQLPIARQSDETVQAAAARLESLLAEVRAAWEERIDSCAGIEQLRAEVAAIEDGAAHRLALVCDELRETMTIAFVRMVLELSRPLRQELMRKRLEVARGRSPKLEQSFDDIRVVLPASLDKTFGALATPDVGEILTGERSLFDPLFRTLAREKRQCVTRLCARLDDIERNTMRDLYAAAVFISPLIVATFKGLVAELVAAHQRWIDALLAEEQLAWNRLCVRHAPALAEVAALEAAEGKLAALLEAA